MKQFPVISTPRLLLRPFTLDDAPAVQTLVSAREVAEGTLTIPHPYPDGAAAQWIAMHQPRFDEDKDLVLAITIRETGEVAGAMGLILKLPHDKAELGYWVGVPYWGRGYATEAAQAMIRYALNEWPLNRIEAFHFSRNPASGRVMQKLGLKHEGTLREDTKKWGQYLDIEVYGALRRELP